MWSSKSIVSCVCGGMDFRIVYTDDFGNRLGKGMKVALLVCMNPQCQHAAKTEIANDTTVWIGRYNVVSHLGLAFMRKLIRRKPKLKKIHYLPEFSKPIE